MCHSANYFVIVLVTLFIQANCSSVSNFYYIDDFQESADPSEWAEHSDNVMSEGKSKSSFVLHKTEVFRRAVLFTMLNPHSSGAALAGIRKNVTLDVQKFKSISLKIKGQGQYKGYGFFLSHKEIPRIDGLSYVHRFEAPNEFEVVHLPINNFEPRLKGKPVENAKPLNNSHIASIGIVAYGGIHMPRKQRGVASLEIDWIRLE